MSFAVNMTPSLTHMRLKQLKLRAGEGGTVTLSALMEDGKATLPRDEKLQERQNAILETFKALYAAIQRVGSPKLNTKLELHTSAWPNGNDEELPNIAIERKGLGLIELVDQASKVSFGSSLQSWQDYKQHAEVFDPLLEQIYQNLEKYEEQPRQIATFSAWQVY